MLSDRSNGLESVFSGASKQLVEGNTTQPRIAPGDVQPQGVFQANPEDDNGDQTDGDVNFGSLLSGLDLGDIDPGNIDLGGGNGAFRDGGGSGFQALASNLSSGDRQTLKLRCLSVLASP